MTKRFHKRLAATVLLATFVCQSNPVAIAQSLKTGGPSTSASVTRTTGGPDEPEFPPRSVRVHGGTLYVEGSQAADGILVTSCVIRFVSPVTGEVIEDINLAEVAGVESVVDIVVYGLAGDDVIRLFLSTTPVTVFAGRGNDSIDGSWAATTTVFGQDGDDLIIGSSENDVLSGDAGNDTIFGKDGSDLIDGGAGDDTLAGSSRDSEKGTLVITSDEAVDYIQGGNGSDIFVLAADGDLSDIVLDYNKSEDSFE